MHLVRYLQICRHWTFVKVEIRFRNTAIYKKMHLRHTATRQVEAIQYKDIIFVSLAGHLDFLAYFIEFNRSSLSEIIKNCWTCVAGPASSVYTALFIAAR